ncbi:MAG: hypothetical protein WB783_20300 [Arenicellales bacterium]
MRDISSWFFRTGVTIVILGMGLGLYMAITEVHILMPVHAHMNVIGWLSFFVIGLYYRIHPEAAAGALPLAQYWFLLVGILLMMVSLSLLLLTGNVFWGPVAGLSGLLMLIGMILFAVTVFGNTRRAAGA